jgi:hypothetical protein
MNAEQERRLRSWLATRDPGEAPTALRTVIAQVPYVTPRASFPALEAAVERVFGPWAPVRPLVYVVLLVLAAAAIVGAALLGHSQPFPPRGLIAYSSPVGSDVHIVAADGTGDRAVTSTPDDLEHSARWSADGTRLVFARFANVQSGGTACRDDGSIVTWDLATRTEHVLATGLGLVVAVEWSPSGGEIGFLEPGTGCVGLDAGVVDIASGRVTTAPLAAGSIHPGTIQLRWAGPSVDLVPLTGDVLSADGRFVAQSTSLRDPSHRLVVLDHQTGASVDLGAGLAASWSPDGAALAFVQPADKPAEYGLSYRDRLALTDVATGAIRTLADVRDPVSGGDFVMSPLYWTIDGRAVYWMDAAGGQVVDVASGQSIALPASVNGCTDLQWQPVSPAG